MPPPPLAAVSARRVCLLPLFLGRLGEKSSFKSNRRATSRSLKQYSHNKTHSLPRLPQPPPPSCSPSQHTCDIDSTNGKLVDKDASMLQS